MNLPLSIYKHLPKKKPLSLGFKKYSMYFDGVDDYVEVPYSDSLRLTEWTIEVMCYPMPTQTRWSRLVSIGIYENAINLGISRAGSNRPFGHFADAKDLHYFVTSPFTFEPNKWQLWTFTFKRPEMKLYYNGELVATVTADADVMSYSSVTRIGHRIIPDELFNGIISEVRFYSRALSDEEIKAHYNYLMKRVSHVRRVFR